MKRTIVLAAATAGFLIAGVGSAEAVSYYSAWQKIPVNYANRCGYVRSHVDNSQELAAGTVKSVTNTGGCQDSNSGFPVPIGWLEIQVLLFNEDTDHVCGGGSFAYNDTGAGRLTQTVYNIGGNGCGLHADQQYDASAYGEMWRDSDSQMYYTIANSPTAFFP